QLGCDLHLPGLSVRQYSDRQEQLRGCDARNRVYLGAADGGRVFAQPAPAEAADCRGRGVMALRRLFSRSAPEPPAAPGRLARIGQLVNIPLLIPVRAFWEQLNEFRPWWPALLPFLAWVGWRAYRRERAAIVRERLAAADQADGS